MANILVESFNAAGYDNADWTEVIGAGSTVDEDSTDVADSAGGATQILKIAKVSPNFNAMTRHEITSAPIVYLTGWVYIASYTLPSAGNAVALFDLLDVATNRLITVKIQKTGDSGNPVKFRALLRDEEAGNYPASGSVSTGQWYKIGLKYDNTNNTYDFSVDDVSVISGAMDHGNNVTRIKIGDNDNGMAFAGYFDEIHLSDSEYYTAEEHSGTTSISGGGVQTTTGTKAFYLPPSVAIPDIGAYEYQGSSGLVISASGSLTTAGYGAISESEPRIASVSGGGLLVSEDTKSVSSAVSISGGGFISFIESPDMDFAVFWDGWTGDITWTENEVEISVEDLMTGVI